MRRSAALLTLPLLMVTLAGQQPAAPAARRRPPQHRLPSCPEMASALTRLMGADARQRDWPLLARYRDANRALPKPAAGESRVVFMGDSITDAWPQRALRRLLRHRQALRRPRHQRPDDAADADPVPAGRDRPEAEGGGDPRRHQRHRRQHRADDQRGDPGQPDVDGGARQGATRSRSSSRASCRPAPTT